jgi:alpha,alpha-trehalase
MTGASADSPPRLDHGVIGNGRVLALISPTSAIEWFCLPRFDSPSLFGRLLDHEKGGTFRILGWDEEIHGNLQYVPNTNVITTRFEKNDCIWDVTDFAPLIPDGLNVQVPIEIVRIVSPVKGHPRLCADFDPRPEYARVQPQFVQTTSGIEIKGANIPLLLTSNLPAAYIMNHREFVLNRPIFFVLSSGNRNEIPSDASVQHELNLTVMAWRAWAKTCALPTFAAAEVLRSALCLKLHVYHDTGAIIAASTTSIPEAMGTQRTWDYRYCWLRDAAFTVEALRRLSHVSEGERFIYFLRDVAEAGPLQPVYGIDGDRYLPEEFLPHLAGFGGNGYVRIGNAASEQRQNDMMGELLLCLETLLTDPRIVHDDPKAFFPLIERLVEEAILVAPTPDTGPWEFRTILRQHTFSHAMCWVAMYRGAGFARRFGRPDLAERWERLASKEQQTVLEQGFNQKLGIFTQGLNGEHGDASNLLLPTLGIIDGRDPRFVSTVENYGHLLVEDGLMLRYRHPDDFGNTTSAFTICSFWWAEALALVGRLDDAVELFHRLVQFANQVGLFSEDIDPNNGALLGNFPQSYTHVGLIHAAITIGELLDARDGKVRAWC